MELPLRLRYDRISWLASVIWFYAMRSRSWLLWIKEGGIMYDIVQDDKWER